MWKCVIFKIPSKPCPCGYFVINGFVPWILCYWILFITVVSKSHRPSLLAIVCDSVEKKKIQCQFHRVIRIYTLKLIKHFCWHQCVTVYRGFTLQWTWKHLKNILKFRGKGGPFPQFINSKNALDISLTGLEPL